MFSAPLHEDSRWEIAQLSSFEREILSNVANKCKRRVLSSEKGVSFLLPWEASRKIDTTHEMCHGSGIKTRR